MKIRLALLDLYDNTPNQGMRCLYALIEKYSDIVEYQVFDVRHKCEIPDTSFDIYISTGGPGHPLEDVDGIWDKKYYELIDALWLHNQQDIPNKKYVFFICHSFQLACHHFKIGRISARKSMSFGTFPAHKTKEGKHEFLFKGLPEPFYIADFRKYQVTEPKMQYLEHHGFKILALEKDRAHVKLERAIMAVRFSEAFFGTQFHPEADGDGMLVWFQQEDRKAHVIKEHGEKKYLQMIADLADPNKIELTENTILPNFMNFAVSAVIANRKIEFAVS